MTVKELIADLKKRDPDSNVSVAVHTDAHGEPVAEAPVQAVRGYYSGQTVLYIHLPTGYAVSKRKKKD